MNQVVLMGRLTKDPEVKAVGEHSVCNFSIAVNRPFAKEDPKADFISCQAWGKTAEFISKYFEKGRMIALCGRLQTRNWEDSDGKKHYMTEVNVSEVFFADSKKTEDAIPNKLKPAAYQDNDSDELPF
jgi:single-strand DNA-binding protein